MIHQIVNKMLIIGKKYMINPKIQRTNFCGQCYSSKRGGKLWIYMGDASWKFTNVADVCNHETPPPRIPKGGGGAELTPPPPPGQVHDQHVQTLVQLGFGRRFLFVMIMNQL